MKLKKLTKEEKDDIAGTIDNEGIYYSIFAGGWIKPEDILSNKEDIRKVKEAIEIIEEFVSIIPQY